MGLSCQLRADGGEVHKIWAGIFTISPIYRELTKQLQYIQEAAGSGSWKDYLSWRNVQVYTFQDGAPVPEANVPAAYDGALTDNQMPARMVVAGFPLSDKDKSFNQREFEAAKSAVRAIYANHPDFAGLFAWRFRGAFLGDGSGEPLNWALEFSKILHPA